MGLPQEILLYSGYVRCTDLRGCRWQLKPTSLRRLMYTTARINNNSVATTLSGRYTVTINSRPRHWTIHWKPQQISVRTRTVLCYELCSLKHPKTAIHKSKRKNRFDLQHRLIISICRQGRGRGLVEDNSIRFSCHGQSVRSSGQRAPFWCTWQIICFIPFVNMKRKKKRTVN